MGKTVMEHVTSLLDLGPSYSFLISYVQSAFRALCEDCVKEPCSQDVQPFADAPGFIAELPPGGGCTMIEQLPRFPHQQEQGARVRLEVQWDRQVIVRVLLGLLLV